MANIWVETPVTKTTINAAIASASPADAVIIPDGIYNNISNKNGNSINFNVSGSSGDGNEIILKAATPGGVKFTGTSYMIVNGNYWILRDIKFEDITSYAPESVSTSLINIYGDYVRVTNCFFKNIGNYGIGYAIQHKTGADNGEIDYNTFENWTAMEALAPHGALNLHIHHNYFMNPIEGDGYSAIHIGGDTIALQTTDSNSIIEYNYFNVCNGDPETISCKISSATFRYNIFDGRDDNGKSGALVLRLGDDNIVESNYFYDIGRGSGGFGIRVYGEGHKIINNYIEGTISGGSSILIGPGNYTTPSTTGYVRSKNVQLINNTIVDTVSTGMYIGKWWPEQTYYPENLTFKNNIIDQSLGVLVRHHGCDGTFTWTTNLHYNNGTATYWIYADEGTPEPGSGIDHATPNLTTGYGIQRLQATSVNAIEDGTPDASVTDDLDGQSRDGTNPDIGCDEYYSAAPNRLPITKNDVGVSWLRALSFAGHRGINRQKPRYNMVRGIWR